MIGTTLEEVRDHIERLASDDGEYRLVCARYGDRPVPAAGLRFPDRPTARAAARATEQYRAALRRYDPKVPRYDVIVCQRYERAEGRSDPESGRSGPRTPESDGTDVPDRIPDEDRWGLSEPVVNGRGRRNERRRRLVEFCHRIAAAVFEALSEGGWRDAETAVMDRYFELAESVPDPDDLCLCLLEGMAAELADRLAAGDRVEVLSRAADRLEPPSVGAFDDGGSGGDDGGSGGDDGGPTDAGEDGTPTDTLSATLGDLRDHGLLEGFVRVSTVSEERDVDAGVGAFAETARIAGYALSPRNGSLPILPIAVELVRRSPERRPTGTRVEPTDNGWTIRVAFDGDDGNDGDADPEGLVTSPIRPPEP
jgi:hypothetical protein